MSDDNVIQFRRQPAPLREPIAQALNAVLTILDIAIARAGTPSDYDEMSEEELTLLRIAARAELAWGMLRKQRIRRGD